MNREKFLALVNEASKILNNRRLDKAFATMPSTYVISKSKAFFQWRADLQHQLNYMKHEKIAVKSYDLLNQLDNAVSEEVFNHLEANISCIAENFNDFVTPQQIANVNLPVPTIKAPKNISPSNKVFIVHGHNEVIQQKTARFLEKLDFDPIILHEQASKGNTIIEKIEKYTDDVCFAVVLYTDCDEGKAKNDEELKPRARQNVVFEHGYLISKLGRERVVALVQDGVETPGDMSGVVYIHLDSGKTWQYDVASEMQALGLDVDKNKI